MIQAFFNRLTRTFFALEIVGLALMVLGLFALHAVGKCNLTLLLCGGYVIFASGREMRGTPSAGNVVSIL